MPIYEYECRKCGRRFQRLVMRQGEEKSLECPDCGGRGITRLISRVAYHVSENDRLAAYEGDARKDDGFYRDTRNIGLHAKQQARKMGVDLGEAFEAKLDKLRTDPGSVLKDSD
jgi:putative FmdB family regulatory protein